MALISLVAWVGLMALMSLVALMGLVSIALYYISLLIGFGKYSIEWQPPICVCRLEMELLRPQYTKFYPFFCKMLNVHM